MSLSVKKAAHREDALRFVGDEVLRLRAEGRVPTVLVSSSADVGVVKNALMERNASFGVRVETVDAWVADRWELFGDGRRIVSPNERVLWARRALEEAKDPLLGSTPGVVSVVADVARDALFPFEDLAAAKRMATEPLTNSEERLCSVLARYRELLAHAGACEQSDAETRVASLAEGDFGVVALGSDEYRPLQVSLLEELADRRPVTIIEEDPFGVAEESARNGELAHLLETLYRPRAMDPIEAHGAVRFLLPAGRYAVPLLIASEVVTCAEAENVAARAQGRSRRPVVVAARDPRKLFEACADHLSAQGLRAVASGRRRFADVAVGRAFLSLFALASESPCAVSWASDFAFGPFSGLSYRRACDLDASWRYDRTVDRMRLASDLAEASESAAGILDACVRGDEQAAFAVLESVVAKRTDFPGAFRSLQLAALARARAFAGDAARAGVPFAQAIDLLSRISVPDGAATDSAAEGVPDVLFVDMETASRRLPCSCAQLVLCDLTSSAYPVRSRDGAATLLLAKIGRAEGLDELDRQRRRMHRAMASACDGIVCERELNTPDASEAYAAVMFEEIVDCYRKDVRSDCEVDKTFGLPLPLCAFARTAGEDAVQEMMTLRSEDASSMRRWDDPVDGAVSEDRRSLIVLPRTRSCADAPTPDNAPALSPSAIETYLECPYKWFALRRLRLSEPDAGFGPLEMGSFSHAVLKTFYLRFQETGAPKVDSSTLGEARATMSSVFDEHVARQFELKRSQNPLIARTAFERTELADLKNRLVNYLDRESMLLPSFEPQYFEYDFGRADPFVYAGAHLCGSIDRIDVNDKGQAVVIDYKGSVSSDYALAASSEASQAQNAVVPHRVQTLIYAQVAKRLLGLDVVGALYVSYGKHAVVSGAFDRSVLGEESLPGINVAACGAPSESAPSFDEVIDATEESLALAVEKLSSGVIAPCPRGGNPCGYCPVLSCASRRSQ